MDREISEILKAQVMRHLSSISINYLFLDEVFSRLKPIHQNMLISSMKGSEIGDGKTRFMVNFTKRGRNQMIIEIAILYDIRIKQKNMISIPRKSSHPTDRVGSEISRP